MNSNQEKTPDLLIEFYSLSKAAKIAKCEQSDLLYAGAHGKIKILVGVPPGYELLLEKKSDFFNLYPRIFGVPHKWCWPKLLVLSKNHCHDLEITGAALLGNARYGYTINQVHQLTGLILPFESDESLSISEMGKHDIFDPRQKWTHWCIHKVGSDAELDVSLAHLWIAKTEIDKFLGPVQDNPCNEVEDYKSDPFYVSRGDLNPFSPANISKFIKNGESPLPKLSFFEKLKKEKRDSYKIYGCIRPRPNNVKEIYQSDMLMSMNQAAFEFWGCSQRNKKPESEKYKLPCWNNKEIIDHFMKLELDIPFNKKLAEAAATLIRPEYAAKGRHSESLDEFEEDYLRSLKKLEIEKNYHRSDKLKYLNRIAEDFWCHSGVFEEDNATYPDEEDLFELLKEVGFSKNLAHNAITLIRPEFAKQRLLSEKRYTKSNISEQDERESPTE